MHIEVKDKEGLIGVLLIGNKGGNGSRYSSSDECIGRMFSKQISLCLLHDYLTQTNLSLQKLTKKFYEPIDLFNLCIVF